MNLVNKTVVNDAKLIICKLGYARIKTAYRALVPLFFLACVPYGNF